MRSTELVAGFECSGNRRPLQGLSSNGRWTGVPLRAVLDQAGVKASAREFVFFGADHGEEEVEFRTQKFKVDQQFGRSLSREKALSPEPLLAYALNGEPLTQASGLAAAAARPRLVRRRQREMAVADPRAGRPVPRQVSGALVPHAARRNDRRRDAVEGNRRHPHAVEVVHRARHARRQPHKVLGVVLNDGTPIKSVEVKVDDGPWQPATIDPATNSKYSWKLFTYTWTGATPGEHTLVSRVTDVNGAVQPTAEALENKKTFLEDNSQHPRKVMIA